MELEFRIIVRVSEGKEEGSLTHSILNRKNTLEFKSSSILFILAHPSHFFTPTQ